MPVSENYSRLFTTFKQIFWTFRIFQTSRTSRTSRQTSRILQTETLRPFWIRPDFPDLPNLSPDFPDPPNWISWTFLDLPGCLVHAYLTAASLGTIYILRKQVLSLFLNHPPTIYVLIASKKGHFLNPPTQSCAYVKDECNGPLRLLSLTYLDQRFFLSSTRSWKEPLFKMANFAWDIQFCLSFCYFFEKSSQYSQKNRYNKGI